MAFVEPITIAQVINEIHRKNYLLPAIQREFVWNVDQITQLFDSLMKEYPISSFLFWQVESNNVDSYQFYEFVRDYHERDGRRNPKANINGERGITAILDGQQRLTSLYIALKGTYAYKLPRKRWDNNSAFPKRRLYLNLLAPLKESEQDYDFRFLTDCEAARNDDDHFWFLVGEMLNLKEPVDVNDYLGEHDIPRFGREKFRYANRTLFKLHEVIHKNKSINFFLERDESLDKVLNIFIRVNSGGTQLSYSDLLLSIATAQWKHRDAREEITTFVDELNQVGDGFNFSKDFVLKSCLVLSGFKDIAFKVDNFNQKNMLTIEENWDRISQAIRGAVVLAASFGYSRYTLTSNNALIPIAYYLQSINAPENFAQSSKYEDDRKKIFKWLVIAQLKRTFGGHADNVLRSMRNSIEQNTGGFPFDAILGSLKGSPKSMTLDDDEIANLLFYQYGQPYTYSALAFLYPSLDFRNRFHQDHIYPKSLFTQRKLEKAGISADKIPFYLENHNNMANLQLLEGVLNQEKSAQEFKAWLAEKYPDPVARKAYMERHYIPDIDLSLENFEEFVVKRREMLIEAFRQRLN